MSRETVLVTGATGTFGQEIIKSLLARDYQVVALVRSEAKGQMLRDEMGASDTALQCEIFEYSGKASDLQGLRTRLQKRPITHLINNARSLETLKVGEGGVTNRDVFQSELSIDVLFPYELTMMIARLGSGLQSVVNIGSMYGLVPPNPALYDGTLEGNPIQYGVAKAALHHLTKELAVRLAQQRIRVNAVAYGGVEGRVDEAFKERYAALVPTRRMLTLSEIPGPIHFLISAEASAVTGHVLVADGGWTTW